MYLVAVEPTKPSHPVFSKLLNLWFQLIALNVKIIHSPYSRYQLSRVAATNPIHQRSADRAEVVGHGVAGGDRLALSISGKLFLATDVGSSRFIHHKIGRECRRVDLVVIGAVAYERSNEIWTFNRLHAH